MAASPEDSLFSSISGGPPDVSASTNTAPSSTPTKQYALSSVNDPLQTGTAAPQAMSSAAPASGTASASGTSSTGGWFDDITKLIGDFLGTASNPGLGIYAGVGALGTKAAGDARDDELKRAGELTALGQPYYDESQALLNQYKTGTLNQSQKQQVDDYSTQSNAQIKSLLSQNGMVDSSVQATQTQQIQRNATQMTQSFLDDALKNSIQLGQTAMTPMMAAVQAEMSADQNYANAVTQLWIGLAQAYAYQQAGGKNGGGSGSSGSLLGDASNLWNDVKGLFGSTDTASNTGSAAGSTIGSGGAGGGLNSAGSGASVGSPSSGGSGSGGSTIGEVGTAATVADKTGVLDGLTSAATTDGIDQAALDSIIAQDGTQAAANPAADAAAATDTAATGTTSALSYVAPVLAVLTILNDAFGSRAYGSHSVSGEPNTQLGQKNMQIPNSPQSMLTANKVGRGYGNNASQGSGQWFQIQADGTPKWLGQGYTKQLDALPGITDAYSAVQDGIKNGTAIKGADGSYTVSVSNNSDGETIYTHSTYVYTVNPDGSASRKNTQWDYNGMGDGPSSTDHALPDWSVNPQSLYDATGGQKGWGTSMQQWLQDVIGIKINQTGNESGGGIGPGA